ncbi:MAG: CDF family Co(II)/Ni(II) efflux transporter DmeF [Verrucomicrobiota bacterium]|jgi:cation diffusion facilitator family transporter
MHLTNPSAWKHSHDFTEDFSTAEKNTRRVLLLTAAMMIAEIIFGLKFHSMALFADGLHMGTHVAAFLITVLAYFFARRHATDASFSFGTGKFGVLGAFTSALVLGGVGLIMAGESFGRLVHPLAIQFNQAIFVACLGLAVNVVSALILKDQHHGHHHRHGHHDGHEHSQDLNLRSAYIHVIADAVTSLLAIAALLSGKYFGWYWMDAIMGLVGSAVIGQWAYSLVRQTTVILLDRIPASSDLPVVIRQGIETDGDSLITDLHIWQVGINKFAAIINVVAHHPKSADEYRQALKIHEELVHISVETQICPEHSDAGEGCA